MLPKKERFSDPRFYVGIVVGVLLIALVAIGYEGTPENFAWPKFTALQAALAAFAILALPVLILIVRRSENGSIDNV